MKRCPTCQRTYADDAPAFCVSDGTRLVAEEEDSEAFDPQKTILASTPPPVPRQYPDPPPANNPQPPPPQVNNPMSNNPILNNPSPGVPMPGNPQGAQPRPPMQPMPHMQQQQPPMQRQQAPWPPPQQGQNWGGPGGYYPPGQGFPPQAKSSGLSIATLAAGALSGLLGFLLFLSFLNVFRLTRDTAVPMLIAGIALGGIAIILGLIALISSRQRAKGMAVVGMILAAATIGFWIYLEADYGILF